MYGLTEIQLVNRFQLQPIKARLRTEPSHLVQRSQTLDMTACLFGFQHAEMLDAELVPPITEGEWQARKAVR